MMRSDTRQHIATNTTMEPRISLVTLGVKDLQRALDFYQKLGWKAQVLDDIAFFQLNGIVFSIFLRKKLAEDTGVRDEGGFSGVALAHNTRSEQEVGKILAEAERAGAKIVKKAQKVFWGGYSGYFADPDGHLWEVAYNPHWKIDAKGNVTLQ